MAASFEWSIAMLERAAQDDGVVVAHWRCKASENEFHKSAFGTCGFNYDASSPGFISYESLTEATVLGWVWDQADGWKDDIEASLQAKIDEDMNPQIKTGVPW